MRSRDLPRFHPSSVHQRWKNAGHAVAVAVGVFDFLCNQPISVARLTLMQPSTGRIC